MKTPLATLMMAGAALLGPVPVWAQQFGQVRVSSSVGEPLQAELDLRGLPPSGQGVRVGVSAVPGAGLPALPPVAARLSVDAAGDGKVVLSTRAPVSEPVVQLVLEFNTPSGQLMREVSLLVNPRGVLQPAAVARLSPAAAEPDTSAGPTIGYSGAPVAALALTAPASPAEGAEPQAAQAARAAAAPAVSRVSRTPQEARQRARQETRGSVRASPELQALRVRRGDTLSGLARRVQGHVQGVSLDQVLVGLYRSNPKAFAGDNMNRLRAGVVLRVPSPARLRGVDAGEATELVVAHSADFDRYRTTLAGQAPQVSVAQSAAQSRTGDVLTPSARVQDGRSAAVAQSPDQLRLSQEAAAKDSQDRELSQIAQEGQRKDADEQMAEVERNLQDLKALAAPAAAPGPAAPAAPAAAVRPEAATPATVPVEAPAAGMISSAQAATPVALAAAGAETPQRSWLRPALGGLLGLLVGAAVLWGWRRWRAPSDFAAFENSRQSDDDGLLVHEGGQTVDTESRLGLTTVGAVGGASVLPMAQGQIEPADVGGSSEGVDPLQEARVYVAYGRVDEAREILEEAIALSPDNIELRRLLLEVLAQGKHTVAYATQAQWMLERTGGSGPDWAAVQSMGREIDPDHWLYRAEVEAVSSALQNTPEPDAPAAAAEPAPVPAPAPTPAPGPVRLQAPAAIPVTGQHMLRSLLVGAGASAGAVALAAAAPAKEAEKEAEEIAPSPPPSPAASPEPHHAAAHVDAPPPLDSDSLNSIELLEPTSSMLDNTLSELPDLPEVTESDLAAVTPASSSVEEGLFDFGDLSLALVDPQPVPDDALVSGAQAVPQPAQEPGSDGEPAKRSA
ncbi:type IV pilus assembly protein FimV [Amphibiibacter pelophylacis]|uniref:FimV/HubP family polar landmark protein n=1 Tax=Amphibiibacter pelophylacis TaxID=1799477 RepID=A0ACC6P3B0_9BURK